LQQSRIIDAGGADVDNRPVQLSTALNLPELQRYLGRVGDRWPLAVVMVGGARVEDLRGAPAQRERGPEFVVVLVSHAFDGMPWLERVYQAGSLWDALEMGDPADVHCYTTPEFLRRRTSTPAIKAVVERGLLLFEDTSPVPLKPPAGSDGH
jgi:uncharacterized protein